MRRLQRLVLLALILTAGCAVLPRKPVYNRMTGTTGIARKKVVDKREPTWLIAGDRTRCSVSTEKYERTGIGDRVICAWVLE
jgi:hypothetical protein